MSTFRLYFRALFGKTGEKGIAINVLVIKLSKGTK